METNTLNEQQKQKIKGYIERAYFAFCDYVSENALAMRDSLSQQYYKEHKEALDSFMNEILEIRNRIAEQYYNVKSLSNVLRSINNKTK